MATVRRNDPCPCGSGKKYKHCHWRIDQRIRREHLQLERAWQTLGQRIWKFGTQRRFAPDLVSAWELYWDNRIPVEAIVGAEESERSRFMDWYVFDYRTANRQRIAELFADEHADELSPLERDLIHDWTATHVSVYEMSDVAQDHIDLQDIFTGEARVAELPAMDGFPGVGLLLLGRLLPVGSALRFAPGAVPMPAYARPELLEFLQPRYAAWQQAHYGADWHDFLNEAGYLLNHFLIRDMEPVELPSPYLPDLDPGESARLVARRMQGEIITTTLDVHYERWLDKPVPEWGGRTPREMVETAEGTEAVEMLLDLLEEIEARRAESGQPAYDVDVLRVKLGLAGDVRTEGGIVLPR